MKEYKGYKIPNTYEEISDHINQNMTRSAILLSVPNLTFRFNRDISITIPITLEDFFNAKDDEVKKKEYVGTYVRCITLFIDNRTASN